MKRKLEVIIDDNDDDLLIPDEEEVSETKGKETKVTTLKNNKVAKVDFSGDEFIPVIQRVLLWMEEHSEGLPTDNIPKLVELISSLCKFTSRIDTNIIFYHLILNNVLKEHDDDGDDRSSSRLNSTATTTTKMYNISTNVKNIHIQGFILNEVDTKSGFSCEFIEALSNSVISLSYHVGGNPLSMKEIIEIIEPHCSFRRFSPSDRVINFLIDQNVVRVDDSLGGYLHYRIPQIPRTYYMPVCY